MRYIRTYKQHHELTNEEINLKKAVVGAALGASLLGGMSSCKKEDIKPISKEQTHQTQSPSQNISREVSINIDKPVHIGRGDTKITIYKNDTLLDTKYNTYSFNMNLKETDFVKIVVEGFNQFCDHHGVYTGGGVSMPYYVGPYTQAYYNNEGDKKYFSNINKNMTRYTGFGPTYNSIASNWPASYPSGSFVTEHTGLCADYTGSTPFQNGTECDHSDVVSVKISSESGMSVDDKIGGTVGKHFLTNYEFAQNYGSFGYHHSFLTTPKKVTYKCSFNQHGLYIDKIEESRDL